MRPALPVTFALLIGAAEAYMSVRIMRVEQKIGTRKETKED
jgi:hypothetical protein